MTIYFDITISNFEPIAFYVVASYSAAGSWTLQSIAAHPTPPVKLCSKYVFCSYLFA